MGGPFTAVLTSTGIGAGVAAAAASSSGLLPTAGVGIALTVGWLMLKRSDSKEDRIEERHQAELSVTRDERNEAVIARAVAEAESADLRRQLAAATADLAALHDRRHRTNQGENT